MISLGINETMVLLQTDSYRVVGKGVSGYRLDIMIEMAHEDALGAISWHLVDQESYNGDGLTNGTDVTPDVLLAALDELMTVRARLLTAETELKSRTTS